LNEPFPGRSFSWSDWAIGIVAVIVIARFLTA